MKIWIKICFFQEYYYFFKKKIANLVGTRYIIRIYICLLSNRGEHFPINVIVGFCVCVNHLVVFWLYLLTSSSVFFSLLLRYVLYTYIYNFLLSSYPFFHCVNSFIWPYPILCKGQTNGQFWADAQLTKGLWSIRHCCVLGQPSPWLNDSSNFLGTILLTSSTGDSFPVPVCSPWLFSLGRTNSIRVETCLKLGTFSIPVFGRERKRKRKKERKYEWTQNTQY